MIQLSIFCADVGSIKNGNFGWAASIWDEPEIIIGTDIEDFANCIAASIADGHKVAVGFECPLFVPVRVDPVAVNAARNGDGNRSWSAGPGASAMATGLVEVLWVMSHVTAMLGDFPEATFDWDEFQNTRSVFFWEAFVSGAAHGVSHTDDALIAVEAFIKALPDIVSANAIQEPRVLSLIGAAALEARWSEDIELLAKPCVVIKV